MARRESNLLWLRDLLEHLRECQQQLEWTEDPEAIRLLTETMIRDLESCRKLCEAVRPRGALQPTA